MELRVRESSCLILWEVVVVSPKAVLFVLSEEESFVPILNGAGCAIAPAPDCLILVGRLDSETSIFGQGKDEGRWISCHVVINNRGHWSARDGVIPTNQLSFGCLSNCEDLGFGVHSSVPSISIAQVPLRGPQLFQGELSALEVSFNLRKIRWCQENRSIH